MLPDFKEYDNEIEQNKHNIKVANKFYTYHASDEVKPSGEGGIDDDYQPTQYKLEIEQKKM